MYREMKKLLITGSIGSGKSEVCRYLRSKAFPVYDCDSRAKALYDENPGLLAAIESLFGEYTHRKFCLVEPPVFSQHFFAEKGLYGGKQARILINPRFST